MATTTSGPVVTPAMAVDVVRAAWDLHGRALARADTTLMASFETGAALEIDSAHCCDRHGNPFGPVQQLAVSVPRQSAYPARFLAHVGTTITTSQTPASGEPWYAFLVFTRHDAASPWLLTLMGGFSTDDASITPPGIDDDGYLRPETSRRPSARSPPSALSPGDGRMG